MGTFKITLAYDGTDFVGWQRQASGSSIQGLIEDALFDLDGREIPVIGAGRTDAGVHALGQVASFSLHRDIDASTLVSALNARLPNTVRVLTAEPVATTFHARYNALAKTYRYRIWNGDVMSPFERAYAWHLTGPLDRAAMVEAASLVEGRHDFAAFQAAGGSTKTSEREMFSSRILGDDVAQDSSPARAALPIHIVYEARGDGFLRHMVRNIVGSLVEIGRGRRPASWLTDVLVRCDRTQAGPTAPPHGLVLVAVEYELQSP